MTVVKLKDNISHLPFWFWRTHFWYQQVSDRKALVLASLAFCSLPLRFFIIFSCHHPRAPAIDWPSMLSYRWRLASSTTPQLLLIRDPRISISVLERRPGTLILLGLGVGSDLGYRSLACSSTRHPVLPCAPRTVGLRTRPSFSALPSLSGLSLSGLLSSLLVQRQTFRLCVSPLGRDG